LDTTGELTEDVDDAIDNRKTVTVDWEDERCTDPPAAMAPLKVASFDIECTSSHGDLPSPIKEYGKTAHEIVIWVSDQFKSVLTNKFSTIWGSSASSGTTYRQATSAKYSPRTRSPTLEKYHSTSMLIFETFSVPKNQTLKRSSSRGLIEDVEQASRSTAARRRSDDSDRLTVNKSGSKEVDKYAFVGGCDDIPGPKCTPLQNRRSDVERVFNRFEIDPDIVTGYNIMGFDFMYIYKRATRYPNTSSTCWRWEGSNRTRRAKPGLRGTLPQPSRSATTF
jgi:DNA polymerase elongation subunit (family B)